jgi:hypothetical protein
MTTIPPSFRVLVLGLIIVPLLFSAWKIQQGYFSIDQLLPQAVYQIQYDFSLSEVQAEQALFVRTYLPESNLHQEITDAQIGGQLLDVQYRQLPEGMQLVWQTSAAQDSTYQLSYRFTYQGQAISYELDEELPLQQNLSAAYDAWLAPSDYIQSDQAEILSKAQALAAGAGSMTDLLRRFYDYTYALESIETSELTDALTTLKQGAASCNGKSRLLVALCRASGIPARVVGGLILQNSQKRTSHLWAEVYVHGKWIPFDALNGHFAHLPQHYLELYRGDHFLISRTADIGFDYQYTIAKQEISSTQLHTDYTLWALPLQAGIPLPMLRLVLLLPLCALVVALFKNVVGIKTFGVFLPAIVAMAMTEIGFGYGAITYCLLIALVGCWHYPLERWGLLYTPKLVILLVVLVGALLLLSLLGLAFDNGVLGAMVFFPIIVLTIAAERFARTIVEDGYQAAILLQLQTLLVIFFCYLICTADFLTGFLLTFPETYLVIIGIMLFLGQWVGLRLTEYYRFRWARHTH